MRPSEPVLDIAAGGRVVGEGPNDYICPHCHARLLTNIESGTNLGVVFRCPSCRGYSRMERRSHIRATIAPYPDLRM